MINGEWARINAVSIFRDPVKPIWEDPVNSEGSEYSTTISGRSAEDLRQTWEKLVMNVIGSQYSYHSNVFCQ